MMPASGTPPALAAPAVSRWCDCSVAAAELPRLDPMWEAYPVVLVTLLGSAEENRERLEYTAVPDIDDGLAKARATLLAEAHAAIDEMTESVAADLGEFSQDLPVEIRPAMRGLPAVAERAAERAAAMLVGPADFHVGRFDEWDPNPPHAEGGLYIVYYYRGAKWCSRCWTPTRWDSLRTRLRSRWTG